jgi:hypothetical protein
MEDLSAFSTKPRPPCCSITFRRSKDARQVWKVAYPLCEVLFLVGVRDDREVRTNALCLQFLQQHSDRV